mgnify:FL=1
MNASAGMDGMATVRALKRMIRAGFTLTVDGTALVVTPTDSLSDEQRQFIRAHKGTLVALLMDAEAVYAALAQTGSSGLAWREGTPADWTGERLLAAQEVLYHDRRMVFTDGRHYLRACAPPVVDFAPDIPAEKFVPAERWCIEYPRSRITAESARCVVDCLPMMDWRTVARDYPGATVWPAPAGLDVAAWIDADK